MLSDPQMMPHGTAGLTKPHFPIHREEQETETCVGVMSPQGWELTHLFQKNQQNALKEQRNHFGSVCFPMVTSIF